MRHLFCLLQSIYSIFSQFRLIMWNRSENVSAKLLKRDQHSFWYLYLLYIGFGFIISLCIDQLKLISHTADWVYVPRFKRLLNVPQSCCTGLSLITTCSTSTDCLYHDHTLMSLNIKTALICEVWTLQALHDPAPVRHTPAHYWSLSGHHVSVHRCMSHKTL